MSISFTITAETAEELFSTIKACNTCVSDSIPAKELPPPALQPVSAPTPAPAPAPAPVPFAPALISQPVSAPVQAQAPIPVAPAPVVPQPPAAPPPAPVAPPKAYTLAEITKAGADLMTGHPEAMPALMALPPKYGVVSLAQLRPDQFGAVATELRALGAKI